MPNNCENFLYIDGPKSDVQSFINAVKTDEKQFDFNKVIPMPVPENTSWTVEHWGTKWGAYEELEWEIEEDGDDAEANIFYMTAWSPATKFLINASKLYTTLTFRHEYGEVGCEFVGSQTIKDGVILKDFNPEWDSEEGIGLRKDIGIYFEQEEE